MKNKNFIAKGIHLFTCNSKFIVNKCGSVLLGNKIINDGKFSLIVDKNAVVSIGDGTYFNDGDMISSKSSITIGSHCQFGPNVKIFDNNHNFTKKEGVLSTHSSAPITIGNNCWLATNVVILKGAEIGDNCVIGAGCVIKGKIPSCSIVTSDNKLRIKPIED